MALILQEILERLKSMDEVELCDTLGLTTEQILERVVDIVEDKADELEKLVDWD